MAAITQEIEPVIASETRMGGYAAMAESAWMGSVQAEEVLDQARARGKSTDQPVEGRAAKGNLLTREYGIRDASILLMVSFFLSALLGGVRQILFNLQFGVGAEANAYYAAFRLPDTLFSLIAGGALSSAMIPVLLSTFRSEGNQAGGRLIQLVLTSLMAFIALVVLLGEIFTPAFVSRLLAPGFDAPTSALTVQLTRIMLIQPVVLAVSSVATAVLNSRNQFFLTALSVVSHNLALIAGILAARISPGLGIYGPTYGVVGGAVLQSIILVPGVLQKGLPLRLVLDLTDRRLREIVRLLIPNGLSVSVNYAGFIVDTSFASRASEAAALPAIYNAFLLVGLPIALLGQAIGQAAFPRLASQAAALEWKKMRRTLYTSLGAAIGLSIPGAAALLLLGRLAIRVLFEHGRFGGPAGDLTFQVLTVYSLALPAYVATELVTRGLIALRDTRTPLLTNSVQLVLRGVLMAILVGQIGTVAIPSAFAISAGLETLALSGVLFSRLAARERTSQIEEVAEPSS